jgi:hypothetical protein
MTLRRLLKVGDDLWQFNAKMRCCGVNGAIPVVVPRVGMVTFTVRLFFYGDRYAGTWQHGKVGGHMSGRIEKKGPADQ